MGLIGTPVATVLLLALWRVALVGNKVGELDVPTRDELQRLGITKHTYQGALDRLVEYRLIEIVRRNPTRVRLLVPELNQEV